MIPCGMLVPVALWQPCELLYTCCLLYLLTYRASIVSPSISWWTAEPLAAWRRDPMTNRSCFFSLYPSLSLRVSRSVTLSGESRAAGDEPGKRDRGPCTVGGRGMIAVHGIVWSGDCRAPRKSLARTYSEHCVEMSSARRGH